MPSPPSIESSSAPANKPSPPMVRALSEICAATERLASLLQPALLANPPAKRTLDELRLSVSLALSLADLEESSIPAAKRKAASGGRRLGRRRPSQPYSWRSISKTLEDGHAWRKYGQKDIQSAKYPRSYFRCTHRNDQGCKAIRHVQLSEEDPSSYVITYLGEHTCGDTPAGQLPSAAPGSLPLISFAGGRAVQEQEAAAAVPSLKQESFDEEVISNPSIGSSPEEHFAGAVPDGGGELADLMELESLLRFDGGGCCFW